MATLKSADNLHCTLLGLDPAAAVVVGTIRALKLHGGLNEKDTLNGVPDAEAVANGLPNLLRHIENIKKFNVPVVVALNKFPLDTDEEVKVVQDECAKVCQLSIHRPRLLLSVCFSVLSSAVIFRSSGSTSLSPTTGPRAELVLRT